MTQAHPPTSQPTAQLAEHLEALIAAHGELLALAAEHRDAIARSSGTDIERISKRQLDLVRAVATLEQHRRAAARAITAGTRAAPPRDPTIQQVLAAIPEPDRTHIAALAARLRERAERLQHDHRVVRRATGLMLAHMEGLMRQVAQALSHAGTYSRAGSVPAGGAQVVSALDVTS